MERFICTMIIVVALCTMSCVSNSSDNGPVNVELKKNHLGYDRLFVNGEEFFVEGAGLEFGNVEALAEYGGNSFRTWRTRNKNEDALEVLEPCA